MSNAHSTSCQLYINHASYNILVVKTKDPADLPLHVCIFVVCRTSPCREFTYTCSCQHVYLYVHVNLSFTLPPGFVNCTSCHLLLSSVQLISLCFPTVRCSVVKLVDQFSIIDHKYWLPSFSLSSHVNHQHLLLCPYPE